MSQETIHERDEAVFVNRPHSIDLSLELERQLEDESLPNSPANARPQSLDPHVLASIVTTLRMNLADVSRERDELAATLQNTRQREHEVGEELSRVRSLQEQAEKELEIQKQKNKEDEESIAMLRSKVEESRRGLMRLQTESRRMSANMSLDLSRAGLPSFGGPASSKRASFTPLTGSGAARMHRRISSVSDSNVGWADAGQADLLSTSPNSQIISLPDVPNSPSHPPVSSKRFSGLFGRSSPPEPLDLGRSGPSNTEIQALRKEVKTLTAALDEARHEITESNEAREASEMCVKALREFIAENNVGSNSAGDVSQPSPMVRGDSSDRKSSGSGNGSGNASLWGFKLWKVEAGGNSATGAVNADTLTSPTLSQAEPITKKLGGFFGSRGSVSSTTTVPPQHREASGAQEPMYNGSDSSSTTAESTAPVSPVEQPYLNVLVHEKGGSPSAIVDHQQLQFHEIEQIR